MAPQNKLGTSSAPFEIPDSDEEDQSPRHPLVIDLTEEDELTFCQSSASLQSPDSQSKGLLTSPSGQPGGSQAQALASQQIFSQKVPGNPSISPIGQKSATLTNGIQRQTFTFDSNNNIEKYRSSVSEVDSNSEDSDIMDRPRRLRRKATRESSPGGLGSSRHTIPSSARTPATYACSEATVPQRANAGKPSHCS
jgi:hypothetical protein